MKSTKLNYRLMKYGSTVILIKRDCYIHSVGFYLLEG